MVNQFKKTKFSYFLPVLIALLMIFSLSSAAFAADTEAADEADDLAAAKYYLQNYAFYSPSDETLAATTVSQMLTLHNKTDRWARYYDVENFAQYNMSNEGESVGIGIYFDIRDGKAVIMGFVPASPAEDSDMEIGDVITKIDGVDISALTKEEIQLKCKGEEGTMVSITIERDGKSIEFIMLRTTLTLQSVGHEMLEGNVGYISISEFTQKTDTQVAAALEDLENDGAKSIILDLRYCPGGTLSSVVNVSGYFVPAGPVIFVSQKIGRQSFLSTDGDNQINLPLAVLVNGETASAAELLTANIQDAGTGAIIGTKTFGKGVMQSVVTLPTGAGIVFTTGQYFSRGYQNVDANGGVTPDIYVADESKQLDRAIQWLSYQENSAVKVTLVVGSKTMFTDGEKNLLQKAPYAKNGTVYVPARDVLSAMGWEIYFYDDCLYGSNGSQHFVLNISTNKVVIGELSYDVKAMYANGSLYLPASFLRDTLGYIIDWNKDIRSISIINQ